MLGEQLAGVRALQRLDDHHLGPEQSDAVDIQPGGVATWDGSDRLISSRVPVTAGAARPAGAAPVGPDRAPGRRSEPR